MKIWFFWNKLTAFETIDFGSPTTQFTKRTNENILGFWQWKYRSGLPPVASVRRGVNDCKQKKFIPEMFIYIVVKGFESGINKSGTQNKFKNIEAKHFDENRKN